ncbi:MAG: acyl-CoA dehydrogenase, partial [Hansschlegelia sp.]
MNAPVRTSPSIPLPAEGFAADQAAARPEDAFAQLFATIASGAADRDRDRVHPYEIIDLIRAARLGAVRLSPAEGGRGVSLRQLIGIVIRLAAADPNVAHALRNHFSFVDRFVRFPHAPHREKWVGRIAGGAIVGLGNTELSSPKIGGSPYATSLTPDGDGFRLNGVKYYSTGTLYADLVIIRATAPGGVGASAIIPTDREGVELVDDWDGAGQRLTGSGTTHLRDVRVEADEIVYDAADVGYGQPYSNTLAQLLVTSIVAGILRNVLGDAVDLLGGRKDRHFYYARTERASDDPQLHQIVGEISSAAFAAEALVLASADALDQLADARERGLPDEALAREAAASAAKTKLI